jgi:hypothetical protein
MPNNLINLWVTKEELSEILHWLDRAYTQDDVTKDGEKLGDRLWSLYNRPEQIIGEDGNESDN